MFHLESNSAVLGAYLRSLIKSRFPSIRKFCRAYIELRDHTADASDEEIRKLLNRFSQILKGNKRIQIDDLPYVTALLGVSCEEVLSAGKDSSSAGGGVAGDSSEYSNDPSVWQEYIGRDC